MFESLAETVDFSLYEVNGKFVWLSHKGREYNSQEFDTKEEAKEWMMVKNGWR